MARDNWIYSDSSLGQFIPSSGLINTLSNEICRETVLKLLLILEWVVDLSIGHAATLKPAVKHLCHPLQLSLAHPRWNGQPINTVEQNTPLNSYTSL